MIMNQQVREQLTRARAGLILDQPFIGALVMRLLLVENNAIPTLAVDGKRILYNAKFVEGLSMSLTKSALAHEVMHCVFDHIGRAGARDPRKWNQAGDYVINQTIKDVGFEIGQGWLLNAAYKGMTADHIYSLLPDSPPGQNDPLDDVTHGGADDTPGHGQPLTPEEVRDWKIATIQSANAAKAMGKLPSEMERFIDGLTKPRVDWKAVLRRFVTQRSDADYTWSRPNRRMLAHGHYLPSLFSESMGEMVVAIDTSGSIDDETLRIFGSELAGIVEDARPSKIHVVYCDSSVNKTVEFGPDDYFKLETVGGGGTAFSPVADWVRENNINPICLVYLTDLYGPTDFTEPEYPWLWCTIGSEEAAFGEVLKVEV
jgi:predicted metal-dependent peptidase